MTTINVIVYTIYTKHLCIIRPNQRLRHNRPTILNAWASQQHWHDEKIANIEFLLYVGRYDHTWLFKTSSKSENRRYFFWKKKTGLQESYATKNDDTNAKSDNQANKNDYHCFTYYYSVLDQSHRLECNYRYFLFIFLIYSFIFFLFSAKKNPALLSIFFSTFSYCRQHTKTPHWL